MFQMINNKKIRTIIHIGFCFLSVLLCLLLIFNSSIVDCYAIAGVDDAALFWLLCAILASCGITYATTEAAEAGASALYSNMDTDTQSVLDNLATKIQDKISMDASLATVGVAFLSDQWTKIIQAVVGTFGSFEGIDVAYDATALLDNPTLSLTNKISVDCGYQTSSSSYIVSVNNFVMSYYGHDSVAFNTLPSAIIDDMTVRCNGRYNDVSMLTIGDFSLCVYINAGTTASNVTTNTILIQNNNNIINNLYYIYNGISSADILSFSNVYYQTFYKGEVISVSYPTTGGFSLSTASIPNIATDLGLSDSICPDGIFTKQTFGEWLVGLGNDVIGGIGALPGSPGIDTTAYPGNDTWHDGSINDDVAVGSPSIGIAVPTTNDDVISLNPDVARDYTNTTTKVDDIAGSDTATGDTTGDTTGDGTNTKPKSTPNTTLPTLSLPEILFKEKFPFCLPWDLYTLFSCLEAEPVAPKFVIPFEFERLGIDEEIVIDFSQFEDVVKIVRFFLSAGFVLGLILISRKMIGAG